MMVDPPIDKLIAKTECRYALTCAVAYRARQLVTNDVETLEKSNLKPVSLAAKEIYNGTILITED